MTAHLIDLAPAADAVAALIAATDNDRLARPTPCHDYRVADLITHLDQVTRGFTAFARGEEPADADPGLGDGWRGRITRQLTELHQAWAEPDAWDGIAGDPELPRRVWGRIVLTELVVHGWDLAWATGQPFELPEPVLRACHRHVAEFVPQAPIPDLWGPAVEAPAGAALIDRIVAITGRDPGA